MVVLEGRAIEPRKPAPTKAAPPVARKPRTQAPADESSTEVDADVVAAVAAKASAARARGAKAPAEPAADGAAPEAIEPTGTAEPVPEAPPPYRPPLDRDLPADLDVAALARSAEGALERRVPGVGLDELLDLASAYRRDGRADAALDTCYLALSLAPDDVGLHLALVELYDERGWTSLAGEKLDLLDRLSALDRGPGARRAGRRGRAAPEA